MSACGSRGPTTFSVLDRLRRASAYGAQSRIPERERNEMKKLVATTIASLLLSGAALAQDIKIALISSKTGPLEAYAKQTEAGLTLGLEFLTGGTMTLN